jgi:hypothetical protein
MWMVFLFGGKKMAADSFGNDVTAVGVPVISTWALRPSHHAPPVEAA